MRKEGNGNSYGERKEKKEKNSQQHKGRNKGKFLQARGDSGSKIVVAPSPKKEVTIPRLELLSGSLAVKFGEFIKTAIHIRNWIVTYWSDSKVALGWIKGDNER